MSDFDTEPRYFFAGLKQLVESRAESFVGREELVTSLLSLARTEGSGGVRVITGPVGSGKTSLLCRLTSLLEDVQPIYHIVSRDSGRDKPRLILQSLVEQITRKYDFPLPVHDDLDVLARDFDNLLVEIDRRGKTEIIIIDGLDEIDIEPLQRVVSLLPSAPPRSTRIFLSARSGTIEDEVIRVLNARQIPVEPLNLSETVRYAAKRHSDLTLDKVADLHQAAEGNPLVLGFLLSGGGDDDHEPGDASSIDRMAAAIERVVDRAAEAVGADIAADVLGVIHVASGEIDRRDLGEILEKVSTHDLRRALGVIDQLLEPHSPRLTYFHKAVHDYLRERFKQREIARFHTLIVDWLSHENLDIGGRRSTLINHLLHRGDLDAAIEQISKETHLDALRVGLGDGRAFQEWFDDWELALAFADQNSRAEGVLARSLVDTVGRYFQYFHDNGLLIRISKPGPDRVLSSLAETTIDDADRALILFILGAIQYHCGDMVAADRYFWDAEQVIDERANDAPVKFRVYQFRGLAAQYSGRFEEALHHYDRSRAEAARSGHPLYHVFSHSCAGNTLTMQARPEDALVEQSRALELLRDPAVDVRSDPDLLSDEHYNTNVASALTRLAESNLALNKLAAAGGFLEEARELYTAIGTRDRYYLYFIQVLAEFELVGAPTGTEVPVDDIRASVSNSFILCRTPSQRARSLRILATCDYLDESYDDAWKLASQGLNLVPGTTAPVERMRLLLVLAQIAGALKKAEEESNFVDAARALAVELDISPTDFDKARDSRVSIPVQRDHPDLAEPEDPHPVHNRLPLVIFDCDGVLVDSEPIAIAHAMSVLSELGWKVTERDVVSRFVGRSDSYMRDAAAAHIGRPLNEWGQLYTEALLSRLKDEAVPVPGIVDALARLDYRSCVASSGSHRKIQTTLSAAGLLDQFAGRIYSSQDVSNGKPAPDLFLHVARAEGVDPTDCIVIEDSRFGALAAQAAGMACVGYVGSTHPDRFDGTGAVAITSMKDLPAAVDSIARALAASRSA
jgi:HAD superfamily hydrolase (TIGR01509 family)